MGRANFLSEKNLPPLKSNMFIKRNILKKIYQKRPADSKKYDFGILLVIGGSEFYSGSPALAGLAAFRAGVDMVRIIAPKRAADIAASFSPNLAAYPLEGNWLESKHLATLLEMTKSAQAISNGKTALVIGGGIGRSEETRKVIIDFLSQIEVPAVIDADGIYCLAKKIEVIFQKPFLITPHAYEFFILTGKKILNLALKEKIQLVKKEAQRLKTTILLKGRIDIISDGKRVALNKTGSPYLTKGGTGDTLAGIAGAILSRGNDPFQAASVAAYINGLAGEKAAKKLGESLLATDLIEEISNVLPRY